MLLALASSAVALVNACADDPATGPAPANGKGPSATLGDSVCPAASPEAGEGCLLPEGTTCAFGACGSSIVRCATGAWRYAGNPMPRPSCPIDFPVAASACPACWPADVQCTYGSSDCTVADASANTTTASCPAGTWTLRITPCAPISDAGADVQGDAATDAD